MAESTIAFAKRHDGLRVADATAQVTVLVQGHKDAPLFLEYRRQALGLDDLFLLGVAGQSLSGQMDGQTALFQCQHKHYCRTGNY